MGDHTDDMQRLLTVVAQQQRTIDQLLARLEPPPPPDPVPAAGPPRRPIDWDVISGPERAQAWLELAAFVEKTVLRYNLHFDVLPCWWRHRNAVAVLTSVWEMNLHTFGPDLSLMSNNAFLDTLNYRVEQLRSIFMSCREDHTDATPKSWMPDTTRREFHAMVQSDPGPAPVPGALNGRPRN